MSEPRYRIKELASRCGVSTRTVDYYTQLGLIQPAARTGGNYRLYDERSVQRLEQIKALQAQRLSLTEIQARLESLDSHGGRAVGTDDTLQALQRIDGDLARVETELAQLGNAVPPAAGDSQALAALRRVAGHAMLRALAVAHILGVIANDHLAGR